MWVIIIIINDELYVRSKESGLVDESDGEKVCTKTGSRKKNTFDRAVQRASNPHLTRTINFFKFIQLYLAMLCKMERVNEWFWWVFKEDNIIQRYEIRL